jgi:hypothetical protein
MAIPDKFRLLCPQGEIRTIEGVDFTFYPVSLRCAAKMAPLLSRLAGHFSLLLGGESRTDQGRTIEDYTTADGDVVSKTVVDPINPDLARLRDEQRERSIAGAVEAILDDRHRLAVGELLMDSLRDDFPRGAKQRSAADIQDFVDQMEVPVFIEFVKGLAAANARIFGDLGKGIGRAVQAKADELLGEIEGREASGTAGSNSRTASSS